MWLPVAPPDLPIATETQLTFAPPTESAASSKVNTPAPLSPIV
jgi:hypothetical protein